MFTYISYFKTEFSYIYIFLSDIPAAVSFPHFLAGDPKLLEDVQGLSPNKEEHGTNIMLQPVSSSSYSHRVTIAYVRFHNLLSDLPETHFYSFSEPRNADGISNENSD